MAYNDHFSLVCEQSGGQRSNTSSHNSNVEQEFALLQIGANTASTSTADFQHNSKGTSAQRYSSQVYDQQSKTSLEPTPHDPHVCRVGFSNLPLLCNYCFCRAFFFLGARFMSTFMHACSTTIDCV